MLDFVVQIGKNPIITLNSGSMTFKDEVIEYAEAPLTRQIMMALLKDYSRPNEKIGELVKMGELIPMKRGLYVADPKVNIAPPEPYLLANHLWGPSYVSLETALSYWGLIPERVYETCSITTKSSKRYKTPLGRFNYCHAPLPYYSFGIKSIQLTPRQVALIASPEKAICDKIITTSGVFLRSQKQAQEFLIEDLRIEEESLRELNHVAITSWICDAPKKQCLSMLVKLIKAL